MRQPDLPLPGVPIPCELRRASSGGGRHALGFGGANHPLVLIELRGDLRTRDSRLAALRVFFVCFVLCAVLCFSFLFVFLPPPRFVFPFFESSLPFGCVF